MWKFNPQVQLYFIPLGGFQAYSYWPWVWTFFAALGLLRGQRWAWWFGVFLFAIESCGNFVSYFLTHDALRSGAGAIIAITFLLFLCHPVVRSYFLRQALTPNHKP
jgi:hypothetical protein